MNDNNVNDKIMEEYVIIENELNHDDIYRNKKLKLLDNLYLISSLQSGDFISNGVIIKNTYFNNIWNYYIDYSIDTINFFEQTINLAKELISDNHYKCNDHVNCDYIDNQKILTPLIKSLSEIKCYKKNHPDNGIIIKLEPIISNLESYIIAELVNRYKQLDNKILNYKIIDDYKIINNETNEITDIIDDYRITQITNNEITNIIDDYKIIDGYRITEITNNEITTNKITNDEITNDEITNDEITNDEIRNDEITNDEITNNETNKTNKTNKTNEITNDEITTNENLNDSFFGDTVEKFSVYNLSSIEKELRKYEYNNKLRNLLKGEIPNRKLYKQKLNFQQIYHNINIIQTIIHVR